MSLPNDPVQQVLQKLNHPKKPSVRTVKLTQNAFRSMKARNRPGSLDKSDHELSRAAALLEYTVREEEGDCIPMKLLAAACHLNIKNFTRVHEIVGNHYESQSAAAATTTTSSTARSAGATRVPSSRRGQEKESTIPALAIKLGTLVHDPSGFAMRAERLYHAFQNHAESKMGKKGLRQLHDMQRYQAAYEAVCFYLIATREQPVSNHRRNHSSKASNNNSSGDDHGDDDNKCLGIDNMLMASKDFTPSLFNQILKHAQELMEEMKKKTENLQKLGDGSKHCNNSKKKDSKKTYISPDTATASGISRTTLSSDSTLAFLEQVGKIDETSLDDLTTNEGLVASNKHNAIGDSIVRSSRYPQAFVEWRRKVLTQSRETAKEAIHKQTGELPGTISDARAIAHAADEVLQTFGLLIQ